MLSVFPLYLFSALFGAILNRIARLTKRYHGKYKSASEQPRNRHLNKKAIELGDEHGKVQTPGGGEIAQHCVDISKQCGKNALRP